MGRASEAAAVFAAAEKICGGFVAFGIIGICVFAANDLLTLGHKGLQFQQLPQPGIGSRQSVRESRPLRFHFVPAWRKLQSLRLKSPFSRTTPGAQLVHNIGLRPKGQEGIPGEFDHISPMSGDEVDERAEIRIEHLR